MSNPSVELAIISIPPLIVFVKSPTAPFALPLKRPATPSYFKPSLGFSIIPLIPDFIDYLAFVNPILIPSLKFFDWCF